MSRSNFRITIFIILQMASLEVSWSSKKAAQRTAKYELIPSDVLQKGKGAASASTATESPVPLVCAETCSGKDAVKSVLEILIFQVKNNFVGYLSQLEEAKNAETFLDSIFGTNCYSHALRDVGEECKGLGQVDKSRLAFMLTGCHLRQLGQKHSSCRADMSLKQCADALDDRGYSTYLKFLAELDRYNYLTPNGLLCKIGNLFMQIYCLA